LRDGLFAEPAFPWLGAACLAGVLPWLLGAKRREAVVSSRAVAGLALLAGAWQFVALFRHRIASQTAADAGVGTPPWGDAALGMAALAFVAVVLDRAPRRAFAVGLSAFAAVALWLLQATPSPHNDVWHFQQAGCAAFLEGTSPYAASIRDIYDNPAGYGPGLVQDGRVLIGFQYPPVIFWADLPFYALTGDYRYGQLAAWLVGATALFAAARDRFGRAVAFLLLFHPRAFFVLEFGWPEPVVVALLGAVAYAARSGSRLMPWLVGAFFASRQYLVIATPLALLLAPRTGGARALGGFLGRAALAGAALTLPLFALDPEAFAKCVWRVQAAMPPRPDALSFLALYAAHHDGVFPPYGIGFVAAGAVFLAALGRGRRDFAAFAGAVTGGFAVFFAFNKFAFCNYYTTVLAAAAAAAATWRRETPEAPDA
jgi:hypothetical protein